MWAGVVAAFLVTYFGPFPPPMGTTAVALVAVAVAVGAARAVARSRPDRPSPDERSERGEPSPDAA